MNFPERLTDEEMRLRCKEWLLAGYRVEGCPWHLGEGRHHYTATYDNSKVFWKLTIYTSSKATKSLESYVKIDPPDGDWTTRASWKAWNG